MKISRAGNHYVTAPSRHDDADCTARYVESTGESHPDPESPHGVIYVDICSIQGLLSPVNTSSRICGMWTVPTHF